MYSRAWRGVQPGCMPVWLRCALQPSAQRAWLIALQSRASHSHSCRPLLCLPHACTITCVCYRSWQLSTQSLCTLLGRQAEWPAMHQHMLDLLRADHYVEPPSMMQADVQTAARQLPGSRATKGLHCGAGASPRRAIPLTWGRSPAMPHGTGACLLSSHFCLPETQSEPIDMEGPAWRRASSGRAQSLTWGCSPAMPTAQVPACYPV